MLKMSEKTRAFLEKHAPDILKIEDRRTLLIELDDWIIANGFTANFETYNALGEEAQEAYDDICFGNM